MSGYGLQMPTSGNLWPAATQNPVSAIGGYMPPVNYGVTAQTMPVNTGVTLNGMSGGQGLLPGSNSFWGSGNKSVLGKGGIGGSEIGWNLDTIGTGIQGIAAIGGLYNAFQANKLAKEQFAFTKEVSNTNLNNQIKSFNTSMEDRALARARLDGREDTAGYTKDYMDKNQLTRSK